MASRNQKQMAQHAYRLWCFLGHIYVRGVGRAGNGLQNGISNIMEGFATNAAFMWTENTTKAYGGFKKGRSWDMDNDDMIAIQKNVEGLEYIVPRLQGWRQSGDKNVVYQSRSGSFGIQGDYPQLVNVEPFKLDKGRFINDIDILQKRKVCVIGPRVAEVLFSKGENPLGQYIRVSGVYFQVIGVTKVDSDIQIGYDKRETVHIPFTTMQQAFNYGNIVHFFSFTALPKHDVSKLEERIAEVLKKRHNIAPDDIGAVGHINIQRQFQMTSTLFTGINILTIIVGFGTLLAGIIGISNIMLVIVKERTKEIGIKRAIGATPFSITKQILLEAIFLTLTAGYIGLTVGTGLNELLGIILSKPEGGGIFLNPGISFRQGITSLIILVVAGALAGMLPAQRAIKVKPIDAIREE